MMYYLLLYIELACFLIGCLLWRKQWPFRYKMLVLLMGLTAFVNWFGTVLIIRYHMNVWLLNLFGPLESLTYIFFFYLESTNVSIRRFYRYLLAAFPLALLITYSIRPTIFVFNEYAYISTLFLLLLAAAGFFIEFMLSRTENVLTRQPAFWLASGVILYCCIHIVFFSLFSFIVRRPDFYRPYYHFVITLSNFLLYTGVTGCFITARKITAL